MMSSVWDETIDYFANQKRKELATAVSSPNPTDMYWQGRADAFQHAENYIRQLIKDRNTVDC